MVMAEYATRSRALVQVGSYEIVRTIGRGNFAVVKLARHRITNSEVAIKIIDKLRLDQLNLKKIYREIQVLKLLNHQHIIKLYQVIETSSKIYLVCEYARNGELFDYITEQGRLPEEKAKKMFWQVLTAVEYCHKNNVVHRDLKAENLLLDSNNNIKLADFGFSNFYQSGNMLSTWCGSPPYAAPEVFEGKVYEGPHLDVWSLGVVLYVLVCGTFPFDGSNLATLKDRVLGGRFRIPYWMSQDCENLVRRMLVINPKKRLTISQIKKHKWMEAHNPTLNLEQSKYSPLLPRKGKLSKYNEHILKIMQGLGMNRQKVQESLNSSAYDDCFAIYHLLSDRLKLHRTSFPLDSSISYDAGRRRPSNIADQALTSMSHTTLLLGVHQEASGMQTNTMETTLENTMAVPEMQFNDVNAGLPTVQCAPAAPMRYSSPPLPQIKTSVYEESSEMATSYGSPPNPTYLVCQNEENLSIPNNNAVNLQYLSANYRQSNVEMEEPNLGNYNLHQRRHTLMVPSPSQMQMLRAGMSVGNQYSPRLSPHTSSSGLANSREEMRTSDYTGSSSNYFSSQGENPNHCDGNSCNLPTCTCKQSSANYNAGNLLLPCKNLPTSANFSYEKRKLDSGTGPQARRRSGIAHIMTNMNSVQNEGTLPEFDTPEAKAAYIIKQRQQLDSSPIGFREGRRASDGLLLLADNNMLKEHLQKLARTKAVPEMTTEDSQETWKSDGKAHKSHRLRVPTSVNRTNSAERAQIQSSPGTTPVGSGSNISYQPYNNNQSLARRRSLQAQHLQIRITSAATANQQPEVPEANLQANSQTSRSPNPTVNANHPVSEQPGFLQFPESDSCFQWSSWKSVNGLNPSEGVTEEPSTMWQKLSVVKAGNNWNEGDLSALVVASDEAVPSKAAVAQQQQTLESLTKPIRQQSLPIQPTSTNHPFGSLQPQSMAQQLQQRRLQRRLHIAASHQHQQSTGYQLPLPELEQLKIDNTGAFRHYQNVGNKSNENLRVSPGLNEQDWALHWPNQGTQYATAPRSYEAHGQLYPNETAIPNGVGPQAFSNFEYVKPINYQASSNQVLISNSLPIGTMDRFADGQFSWSYDASTSYRKSFEFSKDFMAVAENLSNSAERLENRSDAMEFAIY